jgi:hypothetical protein
VYPCGEHHLIGLELVERRDTLVLAQLGAGLGGAGRQPAHPASRLKRPIRGMEDRAVEPIAERVRKLIAPTRPRSRPRGEPRTRPRARRARPDRQPDEGCPCAGRRRPAALRAGRGSARSGARALWLAPGRGRDGQRHKPAQPRGARSRRFARLPRRRPRAPRRDGHAAPPRPVQARMHSLLRRRPRSPRPPAPPAGSKAREGSATLRRATRS